MKKIKILHVLGTLDFGGAETLVMNIFRNVDLSKFEFSFVVHTNEECDYFEEIKSLGGKIYTVPRYNGINHTQYKLAFNKLLKKCNPDIVHAHMRSTASIYLKLAKNQNIKTIIHSHNMSSGTGIKKIVRNLLQKRIYKFTDYFLACSLDAGIWLFGDNIVRQKNFSLLKNAINVEKFLFDNEKRNTMRKKFGIKDEIVLGNVGRLTEQKNQIFLLDILKELKKENTNFKMFIIGSGEKKIDLRKKIIENNLQEDVLLLPATANINDYYQVMDCFLFPSIFEGLGIVAVEAQASGLITLVSEKVPDEVIVSDRVKKIGIKKDQQKIWINEIKKITSNYDRVTGVSKSIIDSGYSIKEMVKKIEDIYIELLKG